MKFKDILIDSLKYPLSDIKMIFLLGAVLLAGEFLQEHINDFSSNYITISILTILVFFFIFLEAGYLFKVIEETIQGNKKLPKFTNLQNMFFHGIKETIVTVTYLIIPVILILMSVFYLNTKISPSTGDETLGIELFSTGMILTFILTFLLLPVFLNMANNHGNLKSGYNFGQIKNKITSIGIKRLLIPYIIIWVTFGTFYILFSEQLREIPLIGIIISQVIITPYLIIFTGRVLGLVDKKMKYGT